MRILVAPDKFKGSLGAAEVAEQIAAGVRDRLPRVEIRILPIADGGEGTAQVICGAVGGEWHTYTVHDALGAEVEARYCTIAADTTAVMEMSEAAGLWRVRDHLRDPERASSFGVGEMLLDAARRGAANIITGLGGSATNDGGFGMARALGFRFLDARGGELGHAVPELLRLRRIEPPAPLRLPAITAAVDVRNPLLGERGATRVFGPQKGATPAQVELLETALARLADVVAESGNDFRDVHGAGAAGGLGFALLSFCGAEIRSGFDVVAERIGLAAAVRDCDVVITGEGRLDAQTLDGKAPAGVAKLARQHGKRIIAVVGECSAGREWQQLFDAVFPLVAAGLTREEAVRHVRKRLRECGRAAGEHLNQRP